MAFFERLNGSNFTTARRLLVAARWLREHPHGRIATGIYDEGYWDATQFRAWFRRCLDRKINREGTRQWRRLGSEYQSDLRCDAQTVNDYYARRLRHTACRNILRTPELRARYPHVSTQSAEAF